MLLYQLTFGKRFRLRTITNVRRWTFCANVTLYLMRTVFLSVISVACSSKSAWVSDEATSTWVPPASGAFSATPLLASPGAPSSFEVAAETASETDAEAEAARMLALEVRCRPPVMDRFRTMVLRRLSSPSISFLTNQQRGVKLVPPCHCPILYFLLNVKQSALVSKLWERHVYVLFTCMW